MSHINVYSKWSTSLLSFQLKIIKNSLIINELLQFKEDKVRVPNFKRVDPNFSHEMPNFSQSLKFNIWLFSLQKHFLNSVLNNFKTIYYKNMSYFDISISFHSSLGTKWTLMGITFAILQAASSDTQFSLFSFPQSFFSFLLSLSLVLPLY